MQNVPPSAARTKSIITLTARQIGLVALLLTGASIRCPGQEPHPTPPVVFPGSQSLDWEGALDRRMRRGADAFLDVKLREADERRDEYWSIDMRSAETFRASIRDNRNRLNTILGTSKVREFPHTHLAFPVREIPVRMERIADDQLPAVIYESPEYKVTRVRWPVLQGVHGEGLLLEPSGSVRADVVVLPDADQHPEQLVGLLPGIPPALQMARRLALSGARVIVPTLINRHEVSPTAPLGQSNREWIYRQAFHMGRHVIGYEIDKIDAALTYLISTRETQRPVGLAGWGEGARLALFAAALDERIDATLASDDWQRAALSWREPIYRNIWSLTTVFDEAYLAVMVAPRKLIIRHSAGPRIDFQLDKAWPIPSPQPFRSFHDASQILQTALQQVGEQADQWLPADWLTVESQDNSSEMAYGTSTFTEFARALQLPETVDRPIDAIAPPVLTVRVAEREQRQVAELDDFTQRLVRASPKVRNQYFLYQVLPELATLSWSTDAIQPISSLQTFVSRTERYRKELLQDVLGEFNDALLPPNPRSRLLETNERWDAYEIVLDVVPNLFAWGILMLPADWRGVEERPLVVVQHGRNGLPENVLRGGYNRIAEKLLERGFLVFAPHNLYRGEDEYRWLDRKANSVGKSLFSILILQHDQITRWLASLPQVDEHRMGFYGNSYGGESAVRIPTVLPRYALSICASDFNDWTQKVASTHDEHSFMRTIEWEMPYFNMGNTFSYAEMAYLMIPRPFMVERGHHDLVAPDDWVAAEYAKVRMVYDQLGIGDRTAITFFQGGHTMRGEATVDFLTRHLGSP